MVLSADVLDRIDDTALADLKDRISEICTCVLILQGNGLHVRIEPIKMKVATLYSRAKQQWVA